MICSGNSSLVVHPEIGRIDNLEERLTGDDVALAVRHSQPETRQSPILLDYPAKNPRQHQKRRRIGRATARCNCA